MWVVAVCFFTTLATVTATSGAINLTCILNQTCTLPCPFEGDLKEASWSREGSTVPIIVKPPGQGHLHPDYKNIASMPEGGAALEIRGVELKHQGLYNCSVTSTTGKKIDRFFYLRVHAPVSEVHVFSVGGNLYCHAHDIYPEPSLKWTMKSEPPAEPQTSVYRSETGLFYVYSSVPRPPDSSYKYTCTVSTGHSTNNKTYEETAPENHNLSYFWILVVILPGAGVCFLIYYCHKSPTTASL